MGKSGETPADNHEAGVDDFLQRAEALSVVGQLAAGMAHEIRNPLASIKGLVQLMKQKPPESVQLSRYLDVMHGEIERANAILEDFLALARPSKPKKSRVVLGDLVEEVARLIEGEAFCQQVEIKLADSGRDLVVEADRQQLKQVLLNLVTNSLAAMPQGGTLGLDLAEGDESIREVALSVFDTGMGMDEETLQHLGKPFFTTKEGGTGLGLAISLRIIKEHGGRISVQSAPGRGSSFTITLPVS